MNRPSYIDSNVNNYTELNGKSNNPIFNIEPKPYRCLIRNVVDNTEKQCLIVYFDIAEGQLAGVFTNDSQNDFNKWNRKGCIWISYEETRKDIFEGFITAVRKSNAGFNWNWDERTLVGKYIVVLYAEEEFLTKDTKEIKIAIKPKMVRSIEALNNGDITYPLPIKRLSATPRTTNSQNNYKQNYAPYNQPNYNNQNNNERQYQNPTYQDIDVDDSDLPF